MQDLCAELTMCFAKQRDFDVYNYAGKTEVTTNKNR